MISQYILKKYNITVNLEDFMSAVECLKRYDYKRYILYNIKTHKIRVKYHEPDITIDDYDNVYIVKYGDDTFTVEKICRMLQKKIALSRLEKLEDMCHEFGYLFTPQTYRLCQKLYTSIYNTDFNFSPCVSPNC